MKKSVLMSTPDYFGIKYEINPWMSIENAVVHQVAFDQWNAILAELNERDVDVQLVTMGVDVPDLVFTANGGLVKDNVVILPNFKYKERHKEVQYLRDWFSEHGFTIKEINPGINYEGEGDTLRFQGKLFGGWGFRSDEEAYSRISEIFDEDVTTLKLVNPKFYHLDISFLPLEETIVYYPGAYDDASRKKIKAACKDHVELTDKEVHDFSANSYVVGKAILGNIKSERLVKELEKRGYEVVSLDTSEFKKSGGSVKCLILNLN